MHHREIETVKIVLHGKGTARAPRHGETTARHATKLYPAPSEMGGRAGKYKGQEVATNKRRQRTQTAGSGIYRGGSPTRRLGAWREGKAEATLAEATVGVAAEGRESEGKLPCDCQGETAAEVGARRRGGQANITHIRVERQQVGAATARETIGGEGHQGKIPSSSNSRRRSNRTQKTSPNSIPTASDVGTP